VSARTLVLLRHGQTAWNAELRGQGHADVPLDETGRAQAAAVAPVLAELAPARVWSSDLLRAQATAATVAAACARPVTVDDRLREFDLGERTGLTLAEFERKMPEEHAAFLRGDVGAVPGAESTEAVAARMLAALQDALAGLAPGECGVVVSHGQSLKLGLLALLGWPLTIAPGWHGLTNCGWAVVDDRGPGDGLGLAAYNRTVGDV
jgi:glucosyl-3-phosphoglycerate phosphatase